MKHSVFHTSVHGPCVRDTVHASTTSLPAIVEKGPGDHWPGKTETRQRNEYWRVIRSSITSPVRQKAGESWTDVSGRQSLHTFFILSPHLFSRPHQLSHLFSCSARQLPIQVFKLFFTPPPSQYSQLCAALCAPWAEKLAARRTGTGCSLACSNSCSLLFSLLFSVLLNVSLEYLQLFKY
jgi:hypothetical protein